MRDIVKKNETHANESTYIGMSTLEIRGVRKCSWKERGVLSWKVSLKVGKNPCPFQPHASPCLGTIFSMISLKYTTLHIYFV